MNINLLHSGISNNEGGAGIDGEAPDMWRQRDCPVFRPMKVYAFDPSQRRALGNVLTVNVEYWPVLPGPVDRASLPSDDPDAPPPINDLLQVVDYDTTNKCFYEPVDIDDRWLVMNGGLDPTEADPRFHQQMVYAVASTTVSSIEAALGRHIHWYRKGPRSPENIWRLRLLPHAFLQANSFYSREAKGILFGYFPADAEEPGANLPGQMVYNCLSYDVIAHETTHAVIDGLRCFFTEPTNDDVAAFHEALADIVALFRHFTYREALLETIRKTGGILYRFQLRPDAVADRGGPVIVGENAVDNPLVVLARQFGQASGLRSGLRSALGTAPGSHNIEWTTEPHDRGSILVAAVFDAYFSVYLQCTANLFRVASFDANSHREVPGPLAEELVGHASRLADKFFRLCVRAVDYCPPVDITFGDYLRALITADFDENPEDGDGVREALVQAFHARGIHPRGVLSLADDSLVWPLAGAGLPRIEGLAFGTGRGLTMAEKDRNAKILDSYVRNPQYAEKLDLHPKYLDGQQLTVPSFHPVHRRLNGLPRMDLVVEVIQTRASRDGFPYRGGSVLIIDESGIIRWVISKRVADEEREKAQRGFWERMGLKPTGQAFHLDFAALHRGV